MSNFHIQPRLLPSRIRLTINQFLMPAILALSVSGYGAGNAYAEEVHDWSGMYVGAFLGSGSASTLIVGNRFTYDRNRAANIVEHEYTGETFGGLWGYNHQYGNIVSGLELELAGTTFDSKRVFNADNDIDNVDLNWYGVIGARAGVAVKNTLLYAKGGLAFGEFYNIGGDMDASGFDFEDAHIKTDVLLGYAIGGGIEHALTEKLSLRIEFMRMDFESYTQANNDTAVPQQQYHVDNGPVDTWKLAISMKF